MKIQIANSEYPDKRLWLELPITNDPNLLKTTGKLAVLVMPGQTEVTPVITDVESPVPNLKKCILANNSVTGIEQLSLLAQKISFMGGIHLGKFSGALDIETVDSIDDIQRIADNLDDYELFPDVSSDKELGVYLVESGDVEIHQSALPYVDYSRVGAEYYANHSCAYGDNCLVVKKDDAGMNRAAVFRLQVTSEYHAEDGMPPISLTLPASPEKLVSVAERLQLYGSAIDGHSIVERSSSIEHLNDLVPETNNVDLLNNLAIEVERLSQMRKPQVMKLCAALEAEMPDSVERAFEIAQELDDYEVVKAGSPYDYGYHVLCESDHEKRDIEVVEEIKDFVDFDRYGEWRMEEDGVRQTDFGMVRRISEPFEMEQGMQMGGLSQ
jgi:hypothetical protein